MEIRACPNCGEKNLEEGSWSDGYDRGWLRRCPECEWSYSDSTFNSSGTHPRKYERWCDNCKTVFETVQDKNNHICTVKNFVEENGQMPIEDFVESLLEYHSSRTTIKEEFVDEVREGNIEVYPNLTWKVRPVNSGPKLDELILETIKEYNGNPSIENLIEQLDIENSLVSKAVHTRAGQLERRGNIKWSMSRGLEIA